MPILVGITYIDLVIFDFVFVNFDYIICDFTDLLVFKGWRTYYLFIRAKDMIQPKEVNNVDDDENQDGSKRNDSEAKELLTELLEASKKKNKKL